MFRKKLKETWWEHSEETPVETMESPAQDPKKKPRKKFRSKHKGDWWDVLGGALEIVIDLIGDLFD